MAASPPVAGRLAIIDVARGVAILAMAFYHAMLDLSPPDFGGFFGLIGLDVLNTPWLRIWARLTAGTFLFLVGVSLVLAHRKGINLPKFLRRLAFIVAAALIVTVATLVVVPDGWVRFGILHAIAATSVIALLFLRLPVLVVIAAAAFAFAAPAFLRADIFNSPALLWVGLSTNVPPMFDYVPVLPWIGPVLLGMAATRIGLRYRLDQTLSRWQPRGLAPRALAVAGRWSLVIYLIHQPILLGLFYLLALALGRSPSFGF